MKLASALSALHFLVWLHQNGAYNFHHRVSLMRAKLSHTTLVARTPSMLGRLYQKLDSEVESTTTAVDDTLILSSASKRCLNDLKQQEQQQHQQKQPQDDQEDESLRVLRTEIGVEWLVKGGNLQDYDRVAPLPLVIMERVLDTVEDAVLHLRRVPYELGWQQHDVKKGHQTTVVVLGSGWAAHAFLKVADTDRLRVIVVSPTNHFVFTPMLAGAAVGTVEYRSMTEAVRSSNPTIDNFIEGEAINVDLQGKKVQVQLASLLKEQQQQNGVSVTSPNGETNKNETSSGEIIELKYDALLVAVGVQSANLVVPGARTHCLTLKTCEDARKLRVALGESFEYASRPDVGREDDEHSMQERARRVTFVIVGGGPTGVELAGELSDFISDITRPRIGSYHKLKDIAKVILVQTGHALLPGFDDNLRDEALRALERRGVEVRLQTRTIEVGEKYVKLRKNDDNQQVEILPMGITVWCAGTSPQSFTNKMRGKLSEAARAPNGRIFVDSWLRPVIDDDPQLFGSIFVLGDAACCKDRMNLDDAQNGSIVEQYLPQTAQVAGQQGAYVARLLSRGYNVSGTPPTLAEPVTFNMTASEYFGRKWLQLRSLDVADPFIFVNLGLLAYVGGGEALSQVQLGNIPVFTYAGSIAFMLWRSVYLVKQVATRNRVLVTFDWIKSYLFGRDVTRL